MEQQVVIAGGGPVGLWLAAELRLGGASVTVIEERTERDARSKALTVHPRTLEILASRDAHRPFLAEGTPFPGGHFGTLDDRLDFSGLDSPFPYTLALPQARTEELIEAHALAAGVRLRRGHRVTGLTESATAVTVRVEGPEGPYDLTADYVVGCDGTRSTVRAAAGIDFPGTPSTVLGWLGDVTLDSPPPPGFTAFTSAGVLMIAALPGGLHRLVGITPEDLRTDWPGDLTLDELRAKTVAITGQDFGMRDPVWLSRFGNATRLAEHYRLGRVLLAGDAAHQHFPAGGVGMNVGIQDAHNLGWKLAATLRGWAPDGLLDTYHAERHPVGADLAEGSRAQVALMTGFSPEGTDLRALISRAIATQPSFNRMLAERLTGLAVSYPPQDPSAHPLTGTRAPDLVFADADAEAGESSLFALLRADSYVLLDLTGAAVSPLGDLARPGLVVRSRSLAETPSTWSGVRAALVRPDGHVAWVGTTPDDAALASAANRVLATTHRDA
ncbi:2-polyprenyl-6-methoxyphenol hydroxylase [Streptoalloteichus tenebrarius]|uniref:2-polyprenyl-6-methoxyphenol hydroxylase n=1 Tax=Streptoalloteichus tenebrarius (strain ATCC 17920 / DSM 40477 / JCM 4838 / CBS 697.72 / NBRC 16177 / NCIMB 11028 / NRRL B-12390 / A12253. 1 / ISP 5477) TaxID=1933 RepID=A0ABT1I056_STRSD|nr:FAD-dependent monooxygenase [Streptoalloteichus tenebrarius]MCP2260990.1 2-polyprenyl-6-methoxyphenol hydroxylase [Streptoalloteichus tenebrarius]BFE98929.1 monooxygenase [Streptoalloteichus tenebrarius]